MTDFRAMLLGCLSRPGDLAPRLVLTDWMLDHGWPEEKALEAIEPPTFSQFLPADYYGIGSGSGSVSGIGRGKTEEDGLMEIGKAYLLETVDWFAWVGRVKRQIGPWEYEFESCSKISETNAGDVWQKLCEGDREYRQRATYVHYRMPVILGLGVVVKVEWAGQTPQEEKLPG